MNRVFQKPKDICSEFQDNLLAFRDGTLSEDMHVKLESHRLECARCRKALIEEERVSSLMTEIPPVIVPPDFRDRVLRAWRLRRDTVAMALPMATLKRFQIALGTIAVILIILPMARLALLTSADNLMGAFDRIPAEYREGINISFNIPTFAEIGAQLLVWQGMLFESMGNIGSAIAPWSGIVITALVVMVFLGIGSWKRFGRKLKTQVNEHH